MCVKLHSRNLITSPCPLLTIMPRVHSGEKINKKKLRGEDGEKKLNLLKRKILEIHISKFFYKLLI